MELGIYPLFVAWKVHFGKTDSLNCCEPVQSTMIDPDIPSNDALVITRTMFGNNPDVTFADSIVKVAGLASIIGYGK